MGITRRKIVEPEIQVIQKEKTSDANLRIRTILFVTKKALYANQTCPLTSGFSIGLPGAHVTISKHSQQEERNSE